MNETLKSALQQVENTREVLHQMRQPGGIVVTKEEWRNWSSLGTDLWNLINEAKTCREDIEAVCDRTVKQWERQEKP